VDVYNALIGSLTFDQQQHLDLYFPRSIQAADGSSIALCYTGDIPTASAKLQQFFGTVESPTVGPPNNCRPVALILLSPSGRPLAQTMDLQFFWKESYMSIRAEMRGRYPKHPWPEDPVSAVPTSRTTKQHEAITGRSGSAVNPFSLGPAPTKKKRGKK
jgi:ATP-dependent helicase HrpB